MGQLKTMITDGDMQYQHKHAARFKDKTFHKLYISTNNASIFLQGRRPSQFEVAGTLCGHEKFFDGLQEKVRDSEPYAPFIQDVSRFLTKRDLTGFNPRKAYKSKLTLEVAQSSFEAKCCRFLQCLEVNSIRSDRFADINIDEQAAKWREMFPDDRTNKRDNTINDNIRTFIQRCLGEKYLPTS